MLAATLLEIPIAMVVLSRALKYSANRFANITASAVTIAFVLVVVRQTFITSSLRPSKFSAVADHLVCLAVARRANGAARNLGGPDKAKAGRRATTRALERRERRLGLA
ncbi:MAG: hypothetical protein M3R54_11085, partial [Chloroflexota bacterium]|nr:hypothetical protein [Chloroflexota bacterium]